MPRGPNPARKLLLGAILAVLIAGCGGAPKKATEAEGATPAPPPIAEESGGYYLDDGPGLKPPPDLESIPDAIPHWEPVREANTKPYIAMGRLYTPMPESMPYRERGVASWYGRRYHGRRTASGETYDMYAMSAAHPTLPLPSYARVTNLRNGKSVVVRINDRGPFHSDRVIDLSYTAAYKLGIVGGGKSMVEVEAIITRPEGESKIAAAPQAPNPAPKPAAPPPPVRREAPTPSTPSAQSPTASVPAATPTPAPAAAGSAADSGYFVQLGAFGRKENADGLMERVRAEFASLAASLRMVVTGSLFRVQVGPYLDAAAARETADRLGRAFSLKPLVIAP